MRRLLKVVGFDPSMSNWGLAIGSLDLDTLQLVIDHVEVTCPDLPKGKQVRQNSRDLEAALQLARGAVAAAKGAHAVFVEVPHGSQSARAMASYGMCVGILGTLRAGGIQFFEVNATEVKQATGLKKDATKKQMIAWAMAKHPEANWATYKQGGELLVSEAKAEHQADAVAAIHAGIASNSFQQVLPMLAVNSRKEISCN